MYCNAVCILILVVYLHFRCCLQDYDEVDIQRGMDLYDQLDGWTTRHAMVNMRVAAYFPVPTKVKGQRVEQQVLFCGSVTKFGRALSEDDVSLYHVVFDDGDEQDFSEHELKMGIELYNLEGVVVDKKGKEKEKEKEKEKSSSGKGSNNSIAKAASPPTSASKRSKVEKEVLETASTATSTSRRRSIHPDAAKSTSSKAAKEVKPTKAAVALFGSKTAKAQAASAAAKKNGTATSSSSRSASRGANNAIASTLDLLEEVGEEEGADDPVWTVQHPSVFKRVAQPFEVPSAVKGKTKFEIYGGETNSFSFVRAMVLFTVYSQLCACWNMVKTHFECVRCACACLTSSFSSSLLLLLLLSRRHGGGVRASHGSRTQGPALPRGLGRRRRAGLRRAGASGGPGAAGK